MTSQLDRLILAGTRQGDRIIGDDSLTVTVSATSTLVLTGVWSMVSNTNSAEDGGLMPDVDAILVIESQDGVDKTLVGKLATGKSKQFRIDNVDVGEVLTHIHLRDENKIM